MRFHRDGSVCLAAPAAGEDSCVIKSIVAGGDRRSTVVQLEQQEEDNNAGKECFHSAEPLRTGRRAKTRCSSGGKIHVAVGKTAETSFRVGKDDQSALTRGFDFLTVHSFERGKREKAGAPGGCETFNKEEENSGAKDANPQSCSSHTSQLRPDKTA